MRIESKIALMLAVTALIGCTDQLETITTETPVEVSLAFAMPTQTAVGTRMTDDIVQLSSDQFRGLQDVQIIPFKKSWDPTTGGSIQKTDSPHLFVVEGDEEARVSGTPYYYYDKCAILQGSASVLVYGRAKTDTDDKAVNGSLTHEFKNNPWEIKFSPTEIRPTVTADTKADALATYMTSIANTTGWSTSTDAKLLALYKNFIVEDNEKGHGILAGSSACILGYLNHLYAEVSKADNTTLATAIRSSIAAQATVDGSGHVTALADDLAGYPANIGLPDGAAALRWVDGRFVPQTTTTTQVAITSVTRFAYPADLQYYGNSLLYTTDKEVTKADYSSINAWSDLLANPYKMEAKPVDIDTKSAAILSPAQYGVARLCVQLNKVSSTLKDSEGTNITILYNSFPLTGIIVGGQYPVGFDFTPEAADDKSSTSEEDLENTMRFVYDPQVKTNKQADDSYDYYYLSTSGKVGTTNTLVLQTYENEKVTVVMEFQNNTGQSFRGKDGIVYPGTKFYLIGEVDPSTHDTSGTVSSDAVGRVFTQDHITTLGITVQSLEKAYNVMPDLLAPRLELGIELVTKWDVIPPTAIEL